MSKIKVTVIKMLSPDQIFDEPIKHPSGDVVKTCTAFKEGDEFLIEEISTRIYQF